MCTVITMRLRCTVKFPKKSLRRRRKTLVYALALRPGGPPLLRLTWIGPPSPDGRDLLREIGLNDVKPWMLQVNPKEVVAVNSIMQLHKLLRPNISSGPVNGPAIDLVLEWIQDLNPRILMVVEQESNHNQPEFLDRFTESLYY
ncbi:hypothetical protein L1987_14232 [Smallanthus sonchifolius]|uniref:Uncharacterized protein n=1 Tax=Smallanthus sonchifolius TaxID=185202 RepID=A0ACB9J389_9ASTR|nr:hypothetical protein L1987_14232 [Smallanthus sonchifolius]